LVILLLTIVLGVAIASSAQSQSRLRILYLNDFHGYAEVQKSDGSTHSGGAAYLAAYVKKLRQGQPTLLLAAGDFIQGSNWVNWLRGRSVISLMNAMGFDAMVVGNHEFDYGLAILRERLSEARFPVLGANVQGFKPLKPYVIQKVQGLRVGIIGLITPDTPALTNPKNVEGLTFQAPEEAVRQYLQEVREKADLVIVLSHMGHQADRDLAAKVPGIDLIIGGHSHTKIMEPVMVGKTLIVQAWEKGKVLGVLDLEVENGKVNLVQGFLQEIKPREIKPDPKVQCLVAKYSKKLNHLCSQKVGLTAVDLVGDSQSIRSRETNLGNLVADIMRQTAQADAALINGGCIRQGMARGVISSKDIFETLPFDNYLVAVKLTGQQVKDTLEHGLAKLPEPHGCFPHVSGLTMSYLPEAPAYSRVQEVTIGGQPLDPNRTYVIATVDFLAAGGDGFRAFGEAIRAGGSFTQEGGALKSNNLVYNDPGTYLRDIVIKNLKQRPEISPQTEGRIKVLDRHANICK
jgi:2',3'-cyclic-nucleotide 2'-phosphodiesterase (5'-nucleotidase family)